MIVIAIVVNSDGGGGLGDDNDGDDNKYNYNDRVVGMLDIWKLIIVVDGCDNKGGWWLMKVMVVDNSGDSRDNPIYAAWRLYKLKKRQRQRRE